MAAPASASTYTVTVAGGAVCDTTSGEWVITWTVANAQEDTAGTIRAATVTPNANISPIAIGASVPKGGDGALTAMQRVVTGTVAEANLSVIVTWGRAAPPSHAEGTVDLSGECTVGPTPEPPASPSPSPSLSPSLSQEPEPSPSPSGPPMREEGGEDDGDLPVTGVDTALIAGGAVALLGLGTSLFLVARRRRITFTA